MKGTQVFPVVLKPKPICSFNSTHIHITMDGHTGRIEASIRGEFSLCEADNNGTGRLEASSQRGLSLCEAENDGPGRVEATGGGEMILCEADNVGTGRIEASGAVELVLCEVDNDGIRRKETSGGGELSSCEADRNQEPCEGMLFESEETARAFYDEYAIRVGFVTRVLSSRKSERDGSIISRGLGCRGGSDNHGVDSVASHKRDGRREGCTAMILVKRERPGRWVVRKFVRDHTHPLVVSLPLHKRRQTFVSFILLLWLQYNLLSYDDLMYTLLFFLVSI
ncbi:unnamed protein product [Ilex paraguariensis]|uniref:FAR1 domain-containing protein n=1 Tax=Ilex paraguariensis TaxID=185542 RepID=A0ABC8TSH0_9AQUA